MKPQSVIIKNLESAFAGESMAQNIVRRLTWPDCPVAKADFEMVLLAA